MHPVPDAFHFVKPDWAKFIILGEIYKCWAKFWPKFRNSEGFFNLFEIVKFKNAGRNFAQNFEMVNDLIYLFNLLEMEKFINVGRHFAQNLKQWVIL